MALVVDVQVRVADHVDDDDGVGLFRQLGGEGFRPQDPIPSGDVAVVLGVDEQQPDPRFQVLGKNAGEFQENGDSRRPVVRSGDRDLPLGRVGILVGDEAGVVVRAQNDPRAAFAAPPDDVFDLLRSVGGRLDFGGPAGSLQFGLDPSMVSDSKAL